MHAESAVAANRKRPLGFHLSGRCRSVWVRIGRLQCVRINISGAQVGTVRACVTGQGLEARAARRVTRESHRQSQAQSGPLGLPREG